MNTTVALTYPKGFITPAGKTISIATMANALKVIRSNPDEDYKGWQWYMVSGHDILRDFRAGMHERINTRANKA